MPTVSQTADSYSVSTESLRVTFMHAGDRWRHLIEVFADGDWHFALSSVEGQPAELTPPSPPFQELRLEQVDDRSYEFQLFGRGAGHVYSAAMRVDEKSESIDCDICVKLRHPGHVEHAVSSYELAANFVAIAHATQSRVEWEFGGEKRQCLLEMISLADQPPTQFTFRPPSRQLQLAANDTANMFREAKSIRWRYRVRTA